MQKDIIKMQVIKEQNKIKVEAFERWQTEKKKFKLQLLVMKRDV